jgi:AraC-like DNA-binding protein
MVRGARVTLRRPEPSLRPYVGCLWFVETTPATRLQTVPDACATLSVELCEDALPECFLAGPRLAAAERLPQLGQAFLGVRLLPGVARLLTGIAVYRLAERRTPLTTLLPDAAARFEHLLTDAQTVEQRFDVLEGFLGQRLVGTHIDARVDRAVKAIEDSAGLLRMAQLARDCHISPRQLHRLVRNWVGIAPKRLARIVRFQAALKRMETAPPGDSQRIAADLGYFDQAHLTNESTHFAGTSPARIVAHHVADFSKTRCG